MHPSRRPFDRQVTSLHPSTQRSALSQLPVTRPFVGSYAGVKMNLSLQLGEDLFQALYGERGERLLLLFSAGWVGHTDCTDTVFPFSVIKMYFT